MRLTRPVMAFGAALMVVAVAQPGIAQDAANDASAPETSAADTPAQNVAAEEAPRRECHLFGVTWDGGSKKSAAARSQSGLRDTIAKWRREQGRNSGWRSDGVTIQAHQMKPNPYWRSRVKSSLYYRPDIRHATSYTVCWKGVISTAVCTSGAKVCK
jgi:hypothetical protein